MASTLFAPEMAKSELAIFAERPVQTDIDSYCFVNVYPLNNTQNSSAPIEFHIPGSGDDYIDLDNTLLCVKAKVTKPDGTNLEQANNVFPVNNWMHSLFSDVTIKLNETQIEGGDFMYPYKAYLSNLLLYGEDVKKNQLQACGYVKDQAGQMAAAANTGFVSRKAFINLSRVFDMVGTLNLDICQQGKLLLNQVDVHLKLTRSKPEFNLISLDNPAIQAKVSIEEAFLKVRRVKVSADRIRQNEAGLALQNAKYPIQRTLVQTYTIPTGSQSHVKENLYRGQTPKLLLIGMVNNADFNGSYATNPFQFRHKFANHVGVYKDGTPVPQIPLTPDFTDNVKQYTECYMNLIDALNLTSTDSDIGISKSEYGNGYTLFAFNLSPDKVIAGHAQPLQDGNLRIDLKFSQALATAINVVTMAIFDDEVEISRLRKVTTNSVA